jgi:hypothetical protein
MPCILDIPEFNALLDAIETLEDLAVQAEDESNLLGIVLTVSARKRVVDEMLAKVGACDIVNEGSPVKRGDCPAYKIAKARIMERMAKRLQGKTMDIILEDDSGPLDGPDGFYQ